MHLSLFGRMRLSRIDHRATQAVVVALSLFILLPVASDVAAQGGPGTAAVDGLGLELVLAFYERQGGGKVALGINGQVVSHHRVIMVKGYGGVLGCRAGNRNLGPIDGRPV